MQCALPVKSPEDPKDQTASNFMVGLTWSIISIHVLSCSQGDANHVHKIHPSWRGAWVWDANGRERGEDWKWRDDSSWSSWQGQSAHSWRGEWERGEWERR
jgi:hypothetical protein